MDFLVGDGFCVVSKKSSFHIDSSFSVGIIWKSQVVLIACF